MYMFYKYKLDINTSIECQLIRMQETWRIGVLQSPITVAFLFIFPDIGNTTGECGHVSPGAFLSLFTL